MTEGGRQGEREWEDGRVQVVMLHDLAARELCCVVSGRASPSHPSHKALSVFVLWMLWGFMRALYEGVRGAQWLQMRWAKKGMMNKT